jgi:hypothetical protein
LVPYRGGDIITAGEYARRQCQIKNNDPDLIELVVLH